MDTTTLDKKKSDTQNQTSELAEDSTSTKNKSRQKKKLTPKDIDPTQYVVVKNGFQGRLVYKSKKTGELFTWNEFGSEQEMELRELKDAKNTYKRFFQNNWFMFDEDWIVDYLGVGHFYENAISIEEFDTIFEKDADEVKKIVEKLSSGQKKSVAYRAKQLISEGKIDSNRVIAALEESLNIELVER